MTDTGRELALGEYETRAQQAIQEFDVADGLELSTRLHQEGQDGGFLEIVGRAGQDGGAHAFAYRAAASDLRSHGDSWFVRRALRSLNDLYLAGKLPPAGQGDEYQGLQPLDAYER